MALGTISNLGFASGILTQDKIDKLKEVDVKAQIDPLTTKIDENNTKKKDLTEILTKLSTFQSAVSSLGDATAFAARKVVASVTNDPPASLTANSGVALQNMKVNVTQVAQNDVFQSQALTNDSGIVNANLKASATFTLFQNGKEYSVTIDQNTTFRELASKINEASSGNIVAKIINTGEKNNPYRLTLSSKNTGEDYKISFFDGKKSTDGKTYDVDAGATQVLQNLGWNLDKSSVQQGQTGSISAQGFTGFGLQNDTAYHVQQAKNAEFVLDGINMIRQSNTIDDITFGLTLTLNKVGEINFDVQQDTESVSKTLEDLATAYNDLVSNLNAATDYNTETGTKGTLQGVTEVNSIKSSILQVLFDTQTVDGTYEDKNGNKINAKVLLSVQDYGLTLSDSGTLNFEKSKFEKKLKDNPELAESFFSGVTKYEDINYTGDLIKTGSLNKYASTGSTTSGTATNQGLTFDKGKFTITFNDEVYDVSKTADGSLFTLTGQNEQEIMNNLVAHINSLGIEGLTVKAETYNQNGDTGYKLNFKGNNGSDFIIKGDSTFLKQFGLQETTVNAEPIEGLGVFSKLKTTLKGMTDKNNGSLTKYDESLDTDNKTLEQEKKNTQALIDKKYEIMQDKFVQYEVILSKLQAQQQAVTQMTNSMANSNSNS